jgi:hypothetical protein
MVFVRRQVPAPSQVPAVMTPSVQSRVTQTVPFGCRVHAPAPLHMPVYEHVDAGLSGHSPSGSVPVVMFAHVPEATPVFATWQAAHCEVQAVLQHTPSTQNPERHS